MMATKSKSQELDKSLFLMTAQGGHKGGGRQTLSFSKLPLVLLTFAANRYSRNGSRIYQKKFGVSVMEWRMLVMLASEPNISAARASQTIGIDKAAVSRSLAVLERKRLAVGAGEKRRAWRLSEKGYALHDEVLQVSLKRNTELLTGFSPEDVEKFNDYLKLLIDNMDNFDSGET